MNIDPNITLGPVRLRITNLAQSITFYRDSLGLTVLAQDEQTATLGAKTTPLVVLDQHSTAKQLPNNSVAGLYHFAILLPNRKELGFVIRNLIAQGVELGQGDHLVSEAFYLSDPDGNGIEIYADRPRETWTYEANGDVKMTTDPVDWQSMLVEAGEEEWYGMPADTVMGHVHFHVKSLEAARKFYVETLGFDVAADASRMRALFLAAGGYHHHIGTNVWAGVDAPETPSDAVGLSYWTLIYPTEASREAAVSAIAQTSYEMNRMEDAVYVTDDAGITVRLALAPSE